MGTPSLAAEIYDRDYFLNVCGGFQEFLVGAVAARLSRAFDYGEVREGMRVLDVGCGRGELAVMCANAGCHVYAIDYSEDSIAIAGENLLRNATSEAAKRAAIQSMDAKSLAFPSRFFDRVFMIDVVEHLYPWELESTLREVKRVTRASGRIVIHTAPNAWLIKPIYLIAGVLFGWKKQPYHVNEQSFFSLQRNLSLLGGKAKVYVSKEPRFFTLGLGPSISSSSLARRAAKGMDAVLDSRLIASLICHSPLKFALGTDLWATVSLSSEGEEVAKGE